MPAMIWQIRGKSFKAEAGCYQSPLSGDHRRTANLDLDLVDEFKTIEKNFKAKAGSNYAASVVNI